MAYSKLSLIVLFLTSTLSLPMTNLFELVRENKLAALESHLKDVIDISGYKDTDGSTLLHATCTPEMTLFLLSCAIDVNCTNTHQDTPLHVVLRQRPTIDRRVVDILLDAGADIAFPNQELKTPAHYIVSQNFEYLIKFFSRIPRCTILNELFVQHKTLAHTFVLCLRRFPSQRLPAIPKDMRRLLVHYIGSPPFKLYNEQDVVRAITDNKIALIKKALNLEDISRATPADIELGIWPEDKHELLDACRPEQYGQPIIESIASQIELRSTYEYDLHDKLIKLKPKEPNQLPSIE